MLKVFKRQPSRMNQSICVKNQLRLEADYGQS
jgi:hypothetical protein